MSAADELLNDVCCRDPQRVAAALQAARGRGEELAPHIVERLEAILADPAAATRKDAPLPGFMLYLAAQFRATAAHPLIARLLRLGEDPVNDLLGDVTTSGGGPILAVTYGGDPSALIGLIEDPAAGPFERGAGLYALAILVHRGQFPRAELLALMVKLASSLNPESASDRMAANQLVENAVRLHAHEIRGTIMDLYERGVADDGYFEREYTGPTLEPDAPPAREAAELDERIDDAWETLQNWAFFDEPRPASRRSRPRTDMRSGSPALAAPASHQPPVPHRAPPKVGRNDPCPCGSGKKFKKCCGK